MVKQTDDIEVLEELDELRDSYTVEDKLFNMTASQMSEQSWRALRKDF
ncbi:MAG: hypothetical protein Q8N55_00740 [bacterium]|nr:hypothetical protein [bacterium]